MHNSAPFVNESTVQADVRYIPYSDAHLATFKMFTYLGSLTCLLGLCFNVINITVFAKMGLKENITITLFFLSLANLCCCIAEIPLFIYLLNGWHPSNSWPFHPTSLVAIRNILADIPTFLDSSISTFLAVARCLCIAKPLKFKVSFTRSRTFIILSFFPLLGSVKTIYQFMCVRIVKTLYMRQIMSMLISDYKSHQTYIIIEAIYSIVINCVFSIICLLCLCIMAYKLKEASQIRQALLRRSVGNPEQINPEMKRGWKYGKGSKTVVGSARSNIKSDGHYNMSTKDIKVVKCVVCVTLLFVSTKILSLTVSLLEIIRPKFSTNVNTKIISEIMSSFCVEIMLIGYSANIFVYYYYDSRFKRTLNNIATMKYKKQQ